MEDSVTLNQAEQRRLLVLNHLEAGALVNGEAAELRGISIRQVGRLPAAYRERGAAALAHGNRAGARPMPSTRLWPPCQVPRVEGHAHRRDARAGRGSARHTSSVRTSPCDGHGRFTRLTNAFSRKVENLAAAVSRHFMHYNFARPHMSLANPYSRTPAMAAGVSDHVWKIEEIVALLAGSR
jgi:hypothetical protein